MSKMWEAVLNSFNYIGDRSGCHQRPERCFCINGYTFPMCARCFGATIGQTVCVILLLFGKVLSIPIAAVMLAIMGIDWGIQWMGWKESTNTRRFITGLLGGYGLFTIYIHIAIIVFQGIRVLIF